MHTRSSSKLSCDQTFNSTSSTNPTPKGRIRRSSKQKVENSNFEENPLPPVPMDENQTMAQLLQAPTDGYEDAIVIPEIAATNFELKHGLINLVQNKQFFGHGKKDPHAHLRYFNKITSTMRVSNVPNSTIKLMLFPFSLEGAARIWLEKEPPRSILTWDDLVSKFINQFFPPSKTTNLRNVITRFQQRFDKSFSEAWDRFNDLLRACPHHGFSEVTTLENELSSTKDIYLKAFITLTKRVKKLQTQLKQKRSRAVIHSSNEEEPSLDIEDSSKQERMIREIDKDKNVKLVSEKGKIHETAEPLKDDDDATLAKPLWNIKRSTTKDKGKDIILKKQKLDEQPNEEVKAQVDSDQDVKVMKLYMRIVPDEEIAIDAIPLATKPPVIVEYKIVKEGKISTYHIIRADESTKRYTSMIKLLENIDREDLETLWKLVKDKHGNKRPEEIMKEFYRVILKLCLSLT
nr:reverse transcriptase domain-containing protein [Tanacetum cinerariifolium]